MQCTFCYFPDDGKFKNKIEEDSEPERHTQHTDMTSHQYSFYLFLTSTYTSLFPSISFSNTTQPYLITNEYCNLNYNTTGCNFDGGDYASTNGYSNSSDDFVSEYFSFWTGLASTLGICIVCCFPLLLPLFLVSTLCFGSFYCIWLSFGLGFELGSWFGSVLT